MPGPQEQWGAGSRPYWAQNDGGLLNKIWNSERPLIFACVVLTKMLSARKDRDIRSRFTSRMKLWERGIHVGLVGDTEGEGYSR